MTRLVTEKDGPVWLVKFHNPPDNVMDQVTADELSALLDEVESSDSVRAVVLTGNGPGVFIRHYDVAELCATGETMAAKNLTFSVQRPIPESVVHTCLRRMEESPIPFIAAINGIAMGGGMEVALACDIRLAQAGDYTLGLPELNIGLLPGAGGTQRMTRVLGEARALEMILTARTITPERAAEVGLVAECVQGEVLSRALEIAGVLAGSSKLAVAHVKHLVRGVAQWSQEEGLARERTLFCDLAVSPDGLRSMRAMVNEQRDIRDMGNTQSEGD